MNIAEKISRREFLKKAAKIVGLGAGAVVLSKAGVDTGITEAFSVRRNTDKREVKETTNLSEVFSNILVSREYLEQNPQDIRDVADVTDLNGDVIKQYILYAKEYDTPDPNNPNRGITYFDNYLYDTHLENGKLTENKPTSLLKLPIGSALSVASSSDGRIVIVGGEREWRSGQTKIIISRDYGKTWDEIPWNFVNSGGTIDLKRINDNVFFINNGNYEGGVSQAFLYINSDTQAANIKAAKFETIKPANFEVGSAKDLVITSVDEFSRRVIAYSTGSYMLQRGINKYIIDDYETAQGTVENISSVRVNGIDTQLGILYGRDFYNDSSGHTHIVTSDPMEQIKYDIDLDERTASEKYYANKLDDKGLPDFFPGSLYIETIDIVKDAQGNKKYTWWGGVRISTNDYGNRAVLYNEETGVVYDLAPDMPSGFNQKRMTRKKIGGQMFYELNIGRGRVIVPINPDGSPDLSAMPIFIGKGIGNLPQVFRVHIPLTAKTSSGGW